jgi:hypothetical protein
MSRSTAEEVIMVEDDKSEISDELNSTESTFTDLRSRQSVRATFKLTDRCIEAISIVAAQLGIKQKSLFDHMFSDTQTLSTIARKFRNKRLESINRIQKTYVISRGALVSLEDIAKNFNAPRDVLIELSVQRLLPVIADERKRHAKRKTVFNRIHKHLQAGLKLLEEAVDELGDQDPISDRLGNAMGVYESAFKHMAAFIAKSEGIETFEPDDYAKVNIVFEDD